MGFQDVIWSVQDTLSLPIDNYISSDKYSKFYKGYKEYGGTTCYGITYNTARCLITWSWPVMYAADGIVDKISETEINRKYWNDYVIHPFICEQSKPSLIDEVDNQCKDVKITRIERWKNYE